MELPFSSPQEAQAALKVTIRSSDNRVMGLGSQPEILLTDDRLLIKVKGWRCAGRLQYTHVDCALTGQF